jgi:hypothetical protein
MRFIMALILLMIVFSAGTSKLALLPMRRCG